MPYPSALSAPNQETKRGGCFAERYLVVHTPTAQLQFHPNANSSANVNAVIPYTTALVGSHTNVLLGMTVIISPTSDYTADLRNQPENCFVTYIRLAATSTTLSIGATKYQFATTDYVTVLNDYRVFERKLRAISPMDIRRDWDIAFRKPKPRIYGIYSQAVFASGSTASISFTPSAEVMAASGTISTWLWNVGGGTITSGSTSTQNITVSFPLGTRYVHLTVTDSNGVSNYLTALIAVLPTDLSSVVHLENANFKISKSLTDGNSAQFVAYDNATWLDGSQAILATYAKYADGTTALSTTMTGWLKDITDTIAPDNEKGLLLELSANLQGITAYAGQIQSEGFYTELRTTPSVWGQFGRLSPYDCLWYLVSEHSTLANVAAFDYPSDHTDFKFCEINIPTGTILDVMNTLSFRCLGGMPNYSPNGEIVFQASLMYVTVDSDRDAAVVYATYEFEDCLGIDFSRYTNVEIRAVAQVEMGCAAFNTTTTIPRVYNSVAPAGKESGYLKEELDSIILPADDTDANNFEKAGKFTANHYFAINENPTLRLALVDGYYTIEPSAFQWHKFIMADSVSGAILTSDERFLCTELSIGYNDEFGTMTVEANFRKEVNGGDNYLQETIYVSTNQPNVQPSVPQFVPQPFLDTELDREDTYDTEDNDNSGNEGVQDPTLPPEQAGQTTTGGSGVVESVTVPLTGDAVYSVNALENGVDYILRVTGDGVIGGTAGSTVVFDFTLGSKLGWEPNFFAGTGDRAIWTGNKWQNIIDPNDNPALVIELPFTWPVGFVLSAVRYWIEEDGSATFNVVYGLAYTNGTSFAVGFGSEGGYVATPGFNKGTRTGFGVEHSIWPGDEDRYITRVEFEGTGTYPDTQGAREVTDTFRGDAFWMKYDISELEAYGTGEGLFINGAEATPHAAFNAGHSYDIPFTGTGATIPFQFVDPDSDYSNNSGALRVDIIRVG